MRALSEIAADLAQGKTTSRALVEEALARIADPQGEGGRAFIRVSTETALCAADESDRLRRRGVVLSPLAGIPISIKDLFDVAGEVTTAGSMLLKDAPAANADAPAVARLRAAGAVFVGRTNMTEFAFSGVGLNPHYGTPANPYDRRTGRIPGGSSAGAAVSVTDSMAAAGLGTDTGGSARIPAALCGLTGFKPTQSRVPLNGVVPLSPSLDSAGPLAPTVACCALLDAILSGVAPDPLPETPLKGLLFAVPQSIVFDGMDAHVAAAFEQALRRLAAAGAEIHDIPLAQLLEIPDINHKGGLAGYESFQIHRERVTRWKDRVDPRVVRRIVKGGEQTEADYRDVISRRAGLIRRVDAAMESFDAWLCPTVPVIAPAFAELDDDAEYDRVNLLLLRNPSVVNFLDRCALSIPCHEPGSAPVGLMLTGKHGQDRRLLAIGQTVQGILRDHSR